jgi:SAM-dependent methyltransferase/uncharacterized protein YbaR (Trm112 family)
MEREFLRSLHCPYTGSYLEVSHVIQEEEERVTYGVVSSEAGQFPIVDGILRLLADDLRIPIVEQILANKRELALMTSLEIPFHSKRGVAINTLHRLGYRVGLRRAAEMLGRSKRGMLDVFADPSEPFTALAKKLGSKAWMNWQTYRYSMPTFLPTYPMLSILKDEGSILDFGSGLGHATFLLSRICEASALACADYSFSTLYLAKKYFVNRGNFLCLDGDYPLPFDAGYFSSVFSSDALHCIDSRFGLSNEFRRILSQHGTIVLPHLHNQLSTTKFGKSMTPQGYSGLFDGIERRLLPGSAVVEQFITKGELDLEQEWTREELNRSASGLSMVVSRNPAVFKKYSGIWDRLLQGSGKTILNPVYRLDDNVGKFRLSKQVAQKYAPEIQIGNIQYLPNSVEIDASLARKIAQGAVDEIAPSQLERLSKGFIVLRAPPQFT